MQSLSGLMGGGGQYSRFERLAGSGNWTPPAGIQMVRVVLVGAGGGGKTYMPGYGSINYQYGYDGWGCGGGAGGYVELDYPIIGLSSFPYNVGAGGSGAVNTNVAQTVASSYFSSNMHVITVGATGINNLPANFPSVGYVSSTAGTLGATTITLATTVPSRVAAGWIATYTNNTTTANGTVLSKSGAVVTLTAPTTLAIAASSLVTFNPPGGTPATSLYQPSTSYGATSCVIYEAGSILYALGKSSGDTLPTTAALYACIQTAAMSAGGDTSFGNLTVTGGATNYINWNYLRSYVGGVQTASIMSPSYGTPPPYYFGNAVFGLTQAVSNGSCQGQAVGGNATHMAARFGLGGISAANYGTPSNPVGADAIGYGNGAGGSDGPVTTALIASKGGKGANGTIILLY